MSLRKINDRLAPAHDTPAGQAAFERDLEAVGVDVRETG